MNLADNAVIAQTKKWIMDVVVGCNFCPFAAKEMKKGSVHYEVLSKATIKSAMAMSIKLMEQLDADTAIETSILILPGSFLSFSKYLELLSKAELDLSKKNYGGIYQLAGFHPDYLFKGTSPTDPSNYTNRSPYPLLHLIRESSISKAADNYPGIEHIPARNIAFAKEKGLLYMQQLLMS